MAGRKDLRNGKQSIGHIYISSNNKIKRLWFFHGLNILCNVQMQAVEWYMNILVYIYTLHFPESDQVLHFFFSIYIFISLELYDQDFLSLRLTYWPSLFVFAILLQSLNPCISCIYINVTRRKIIRVFFQ